MGCSEEQTHRKSSPNSTVQLDSTVKLLSAHCFRFTSHNFSPLIQSHGSHQPRLQLVVLATVHQRVCRISFDHRVQTCVRCSACNGFLPVWSWLQKWPIICNRNSESDWSYFFFISEQERLSSTKFHMLILKDQWHFCVQAHILCLLNQRITAEAGWLNVAKAVR